MKNFTDKVAETADFLKARTHRLPEIGVLTGTGLGESVEFLDTSATFEYQEVPHFPSSTVESHIGRLVFGNVGDKTVMALQGRFHLYEGYTPPEVIFPIRVMQELGVRIVILTNAAGGINPAFETGDIMIITDHINLTGSNPLVGPNQERWGGRFPDMAEAYDKELAVLAQSAAERSGNHLQKGVYAGLLGPSLETPAEIRFLRHIGADAVGFSTVHEAIAAVHAGMRLLGLSTITNVHSPDAPVPTSVEEIISVARGAVPKLNAIVRSIVETA